MFNTEQYSFNNINLYFIRMVWVLNIIRMERNILENLRKKEGYTNIFIIRKKKNVFTI